MNPDYYLRQLDIVHPDQLTLPIAIIGAGGIGSWTALSLGKLECQNIAIFDFDVVEEQNIGCQFYNHYDLGRSKVEALMDRLANVLDGNLIMPSKLELDAQNARKLLENFPIVIAAVDNIDTRRTVFEALKGTDIIYIDGRMSADALQILSIPMNDPAAVTFYEDSLFPADEAEEAPCTAQSVVYNCFVIAGLIGSLVAKVAQKQQVPPEVVIDLKNYDLEKQ